MYMRAILLALPLATMKAEDLTCADYHEAIQETLQRVLDTVQDTIKEGKPLDYAHDLIPQAVDLIRVLNNEHAVKCADDLHVVLGLLHAADHLILDERDAVLTQASRWTKTTKDLVYQDEDLLDTQLVPNPNPLRTSRTSGLARGTDSITIERLEQAKGRRIVEETFRK